VTRATGALLPDPIVPDARPADSSPAADPTPAVSIDTSANPLDRLSEPELHVWRQTGTLPDPKVVTPPAASSAAPVVQDQPASTDAPTEPASEPATPAKAKGADARIPELLADRAKERERAERAERRLAELESRSRQPPPDARPAVSSAAPADLVEPDPAAYDYGTSDPGYVKAVAKFEAAAFVAAERATWAAEQQAARSRDEHARVVSAFEAKAAAARAKHPDFDAVAMLAPTEIPQGSAVDLFVLEDPAGAELLYHLQQPTHTAELRRILALAPLDQLKALTRLGDRLTAADPATRLTGAPPPPPVLSTRALPGDAVENAVRRHDARAYIDAANAREIAARRK
jgi:hypothetical protein